MKDHISPLKWKKNKLYLLDQRILPHKKKYITVSNIEECSHAIKDMVVRGAPLIGFTAIYGLILWLQDKNNYSMQGFTKGCQFLKDARPTAVNLAYEIDNCFKIAQKYYDKHEKLEGLSDELKDFVHRQIINLDTNNLSTAKYAQKHLKNIFGQSKLRLMTICNTGRLACGTLGTALGVISYLFSLNKVSKVWVSETRPFFQGTRLTAFELHDMGINYDIVIEGASSHLINNGLVDAIFVGADRIVRNGDTANKIGTCNLAIIAKNYNIPFYVVAPTSSFDLSLENGKKIDVEIRNQEEVLSYNGSRIASKNATAYNPAFDITPGKLISAIFCEKGVIEPVNKKNILRFF